MKKNTMMRIASVLLVAVLMTTCVISGTFAKYVASQNVSDSARVALWSFIVGADDDIVDEAFVFDLFNTTTYTDTAVDTNGAADDNVVIAPGTTGSFVLKIKNASEVAASYTIEFEETANANSIPIEYSVNGTTWVSGANIGNLDVEAELQYNTAAEDLTVYWRWAFTGAQSTNYTSSQTDDTDTALGTNGTASVTVKATITATQLDVYPTP